MISSEVRAEVARFALGIRVFQRRLRHLLGEGESAHNSAESTGSTENCPPDDVPGAIFLFLSVIEGMDLKHAAEVAELSPTTAAALLANARSRSFPADLVKAFAIRQSLPTWLAQRWIRERGERDANALMAAMNQPGPIVFRANEERGNRRDLAARLNLEGITTTPGRVAPASLIAVGRPNIRASAAYREGAFEVQDEASQLVALAADVDGKERVWDVCAGRGGKTLALAAQVGDRGQVLATDIDAGALRDLDVRLRRVGVRNVVAQQLSATGVHDIASGARFDAVIVDAPCSSLGTLRRSPDRRWTTSEDDLAKWAGVGATILRDAAPGVACGGTLIYATCTLVHEENDAVIDAFLTAHPNFSELPLSQAWGSEVAHRVLCAGRHGDSGLGARAELTPHRHGTDGFFIASLTRTG